MINTTEALSLAVQAHRAGNLAQAESLYRQILQADPNHPDAWHLLGVIAQQVGQSALAVECIQRAIGLYPSAAVYYSNLGEAQSALGRIDEAIASYQRAVVLDSGNAEINF